MTTRLFAIYAVGVTIIWATIIAAVICWLLWW
ncbi:hypothetical protein HNQ72_000859 [Rhizobium wenxiniae]|uniref:Uncharacterized protein n=1 Tax=Rhizobium wenxiniae TaxID=1737357 RepID=A0A7W9Y3D8_9HYPH|nr:hypothetical protein [Rhizobium wenxiniae]